MCSTKSVCSDTMKAKLLFEYNRPEQEGQNGESYIRSVLERNGYVKSEIKVLKLKPINKPYSKMSPNEFVKYQTSLCSSLNEGEFLTQVVLYIDVYGGVHRSDFLVKLKGSNTLTVIESRLQQSSGTADEKFVHLFMNCFYHCPFKTIILEWGGGAKQKARSYLKRICSSKFEASKEHFDVTSPSIKDKELPLVFDSFESFQRFISSLKINNFYTKEKEKAKQQTTIQAFNID